MKHAKRPLIIGAAAPLLESVFPQPSSAVAASFTCHAPFSFTVITRNTVGTFPSMFPSEW